jgi:hypothetical protein
LKLPSIKILTKYIGLAVSLQISFAIIGCGVSVAKDDGGDAQGIRHRISISVKFHSLATDHPSTAFLKVRVKISDFALESRFVGDVTATMSDFDPMKGISDHVVWEDSKCHHERGIPKATILEVGGSIKDQQNEVPIAAIIRRTGLLAPSDQVTTPASLVPGRDETSSFYIIHVETTKSRLALDLKLRAVPCMIMSDRLSSVISISE